MADIDEDKEFELLLAEKNHRALIRTTSLLAKAADRIEKGLDQMVGSDEFRKSIKELTGTLAKVRTEISAALDREDMDERMEESSQNINAMLNGVAERLQKIANYKPPTYTFIINRNKFSGLIESVDVKPINY